jgi:hypothetical protein
MTTPSRRQRAAGAELPRAASAGQVRPLVAATGLFASPGAVRRAVTAYAADAHLTAGKRAEAVRTVGVLSLAVAALARQMPGEFAPDRAVPTSLAGLGALSGIAGRGLVLTLDQLAAAGIARVTNDSGGLLVALEAELWAPHPLLAATPWPAVVSALTSCGAPLTSSLAVLAELLVLTEERLQAAGPVAPGTAPVAALIDTAAARIDASCRSLSARTEYHASRVDRALAGLESAGCITRQVRRGSSGAVTVVPWVVGVGEPPAVAAAPNRVQSEAPAPRPPVVTPAPAPRTSSAPDGAEDSYVVEFRGMSAVIGAGDTVDISGRDTQGRRIIRIQTDEGDLVIRPVRQTRG